MTSAATIPIWSQSMYPWWGNNILDKIPKPAYHGHRFRAHYSSRGCPVLRRSGQLPKLFGSAPLAKGRQVPALRRSGRSVSGEVQPLALPGKARSTPVHPEDRDHHGRFPSRPGQMAHSHVADCELQEWHQFIRSPPGAGNHPKVSMVFGPPHPACSDDDKNTGSP
jgi:hypothetical protein